MSATLTTPPTAAPCVIYTRVSKDDKDDHLAVDRQEKSCRKLAAKRGFHIDRVYSDNDISAFSGRKRPDYQRMLDDLAVNPRPVLSIHTDRIHRDPPELEQWINLAEPRDICVYTVNAGPIDLSTPAGRMTARNHVAAAKYESEVKRQRLKDKMTEKAENGQWLGGPCPFGWRFVDPDATPKRLELDPDESRLVATGIRKLLDGGSLRAVTRDFEASGIRPRKAPKWSRIGVRTVLARWRNAAVHEHLGEVSPDPADWPAIEDADGKPITIGDIQAVREALDKQAAGANYGNRSEWLLSGIAVCPCGKPVRVATGRKPYRTKVYRCTAGGTGHVSRAVEPVDELVELFMVTWLSDPDRFADRFAASAAPGVDVSALRTERKRARDRLADLVSMLADGDMSRAEYTSARKRVVERIERAERELNAATRTSPAATLASATDPVAAWNAADLDTKRSVIREVAAVTLLPVGGGHRPFNPDSVVIEPRKR